MTTGPGNDGLAAPPLGALSPCPSTGPSRSSRLPWNPNLWLYAPGLLRFPQIIPKLVSNYFQLLVLRRKRLRSIDFSITFNCQCFCDHCYSHAMRAPDRQRLTCEQSLNVIDQALALGAIVINFAGGEPLCEPDLLRYIRHVSPWRGVTTLMTNGLLLNRAMAKDLKRAGLYAMGVSVDSDRPEVHDRIRNYAGAWEKAIAGIGYARDEGITVMMNTIITQSKVEDGTIDRLYELSRRMSVILNVCFPSPVGNRARLGFETFSPECWVKVERLLTLANVRWDGQSNYLTEGCAAGVEKISVSVYGDVIPCAIIQASFGNVREKSLRTIWLAMSRCETFRTVHSRCVASQDLAFFHDYMEPINRHPALPCPAEEVFGPPPEAP